MGNIFHNREHILSTLSPVEAQMDTFSEKSDSFLVARRGRKQTGRENIHISGSNTKSVNNQTDLCVCE